MIAIKSIIGIADFWGWLQLLGSIIGVIYVYRYKNEIAEKYIKKTIFKSVGIPTNILFNMKNGRNKRPIADKKYKRNVGELSKKIVASRQKWRCKSCKDLLDFTYEIDHVIPLYKGGSNQMNNLRALCRNCHGRITMLDKIM